MTAVGRRAGPFALAGTVLLWLAACGPPDPCHTAQARRLHRYSVPYAGHWVVARADSLTFPELGDRFRLTDVVLDTTRTLFGRECVFQGRLTFAVPPETLDVRWYGQPEQALVIGWPPELGAIAGASLAWYGRDSLRGSLLFDERLGVRIRPGVTAQFVAGREATETPDR